MNTNAKSVLRGSDRKIVSLYESVSSDSMALGHYQTTEEDYHMPGIVPAERPKPKGQTYHDEVEDLKTQGLSNADAIREVAKKHSATENAVRGGIHQYLSRHAGGASSSRRGSRTARAAKTVDDYVANARTALESARDLIDQEVNEAKAALDAAQARYDQAVASVKERKADIEKKLKALE
jgi:hypothetical protein